MSGRSSEENRLIDPSNSFIRCITSTLGLMGLVASITLSGNVRFVSSIYFRPPPRRNISIAVCIFLLRVFSSGQW